MNKTKLKKAWLSEEACAHIKGWDFSHIGGRYDEERDLPWNYENTVKQYLLPQSMLLDTDTGGGEFLLSLLHPCKNTAATENYPPNVILCKQKLLPMGIDFKAADCGKKLPFADNSFDVAINRHGDFNAKELYRVLKQGGIFITEQVGAKNDRELVDLLLPGIPLPFPKQHLSITENVFSQAGFEILINKEAFRPIKFYDVGALVWFARIIEWEFPGFSVERCLNRLYKAQDILEKTGCVEGTIHRFLLVAKKK